MIDPVRQLEDQSIHNFDVEYWLKKATILKRLIDDDEKRKEFFDDDKIGFLHFELYSTKVHCCETLLRLLVLTKKGYFRPLLPLIKLDFRKFHPEVEKMQNNLEEYLEDSHEFFKKHFYPFAESDKVQVDKSINFLKKSIPFLITEYLERGAYNVFKHGYYGSTTQENTLSMESGKIPIGKAPNMITWYEINEFKDHHKLEHISKAISSQREMNIIKLSTSILSQLFKIKRAILNKSNSVTMSFFTDIDLDKIFSIYSYDTTLDNMKFSYEITLPNDFP